MKLSTSLKHKISQCETEMTDFMKKYLARVKIITRIAKGKNIILILFNQIKIPIYLHFFHFQIFIFKNNNNNWIIYNS